MSTDLTLASCDRDGRVRVAGVRLHDRAPSQTGRLWPVAVQPGLVVLARSPHLGVGAMLSVRIAASRIHLGTHLARRLGPRDRVLVRVTEDFVIVVTPDLTAALIDDLVARRNRQHEWW